MKRLVKRWRWGVMGVGTAVIALLCVATVSNATSTTTPMGAGDTMHVTCPNDLSTANQVTNAIDLNCAPNPTTTTTPPTTTPPTTTPPTTTGGGGGTSTPCPQFLTMSSATQAFCDPMNTNQSVSGTRSGSLNGTLWGVSRWTGSDNPSQNLMFNWADSTQNQCGSNVQVSNLSDVNNCSGETVESQNDNGVIQTLAMYPRQPFNFAGRTGVVEFNVSDNSQQSHAAWPALVISDQPVPAPWSDTAISDTGTHARNSIGVDLVGDNTSNPHCITGQIFYTTNYVPTAVGGSDGCALASSNVTQMNHVEVQVNATSMTVYMSDAGTSNMVQIAQANFAVPLTQGLVWLEDVHYNGDKFGTQQTDTFGWNDLAFDGPILPRDLGFDVPDNTASGPSAMSGQPTTNLGYHINPSCCYTSGTSVTLKTTNGPTAADISAASGALLVMDEQSGTSDLAVTVNGNALPGFSPPSGTFAIPVPLSDIVPGQNTFTFAYADGANGDIANMDLILQGAGGVVQPS